ncbi:MAG TPA: tetratricopeptide repeat protein [Polyangiaceae bacterium]|jgi:tetratricopeptide (TPR) repeat protein
MDPPTGSERIGAAALDALPGAATESEGDREANAPIGHEDFLFHMYRGSELLQENRVLEAQEELEFALRLQPGDPKAEDLLGAAYFRLALYPRAIQLYEDLASRFPRDASTHVNLALCHLKSGEPDRARVALRAAVELDPNHKRAWGYLGLALQKLGDLDEAQAAFERGGHALMAKRTADRRLYPSRAPGFDSHKHLDEGVRSVAETAFSELDSGDLRFSLAESDPTRGGEGAWHTLEMGSAEWHANPRAASVPPPPSRIPPEPAPVLPALEIEPGLVAALHATGVAVVRVDPDQAFAARLDALRVVAGSATTRALFRRAHGADTSDVLGGIGSPLVRVAGASQLILGPRPQREIAILSLEEDAASVREDTVLGFDLRLAHESSRLVLDPDTPGVRSAVDGVAIVHLRGAGPLVLEVAGKLATVACHPARPLLVRRECLVGWLGKIAPRPLPAAQSPNGQRGLVAFAGEGTVLVSFG